MKGFAGTVVKGQGDGYMVAYQSARSGVWSAIELQRTFARRRDAEADPLLRLRIGLHSGRMISDEGDYYGRNVVLAARVADLAAGGEILVSCDLRDFTQTDPTLEYLPKGTFQLKGLKGEHELHAVRWDRRGS